MSNFPVDGKNVVPAKDGVGFVVKYVPDGYILTDGHAKYTAGTKVPGNGRRIGTPDSKWDLQEVEEEASVAGPDTPAGASGPEPTAEGVSAEGGEGGGLSADEVAALQEQGVLPSDEDIAESLSGEEETAGPDGVADVEADGPPAIDLSDADPASAEKIEEYLDKAAQGSTTVEDDIEASEILADLTEEVGEDGTRSLEVTVNGQRVRLSGKVLEEYEELKAERDAVYASTEKQIHGKHKDHAQGRRKAAGMEFSAKVRQLTGLLTPTEQAQKDAQAKRISEGKEAVYEDKAGHASVVEILGKPVFGKVAVRNAAGVEFKVDASHLDVIAPKEEPIDGVEVLTESTALSTEIDGTGWEIDGPKDPKSPAHVAAEEDAQKLIDDAQGLLDDEGQADEGADDSVSDLLSDELSGSSAEDGELEAEPETDVDGLMPHYEEEDPQLNEPEEYFDRELSNRVNRDINNGLNNSLGGALRTSRDFAGAKSALIKKYGLAQVGRAERQYVHSRLGMAMSQMGTSVKSYTDYLEQMTATAVNPVTGTKMYAMFEPLTQIYTDLGYEPDAARAMAYGQLESLSDPYTQDTLLSFNETFTGEGFRQGLAYNARTLGQNIKYSTSDFDEPREPEVVAPEDLTADLAAASASKYNTSAILALAEGVERPEFTPVEKMALLANLVSYDREADRPSINVGKLASALKHGFYKASLAKENHDDIDSIYSAAEGLISGLNRSSFAMLADEFDVVDAFQELMETVSGMDTLDAGTARSLQRSVAKIAAAKFTEFKRSEEGEGWSLADATDGDIEDLRSAIRSVCHVGELAHAASFGTAADSLLFDAESIKDQPEFYRKIALFQERGIDSPSKLSLRRVTHTEAAEEGATAASSDAEAAGSTEADAELEAGIEVDDLEDALEVDEAAPALGEAGNTIEAEDAPAEEPVEAEAEGGETATEDAQEEAVAVTGTAGKLANGDDLWPVDLMDLPAGESFNLTSSDGSTDYAINPFAGDGAAAVTVTTDGVATELPLEGEQFEGLVDAMLESVDSNSFDPVESFINGVVQEHVNSQLAVEQAEAEASEEPAALVEDVEPAAEAPEPTGNIIDDILSGAAEDHVGDGIEEEAPAAEDIEEEGLEEAGEATEDSMEWAEEGLDETGEVPELSAEEQMQAQAQEQLTKALESSSERRLALVDQLDAQDDALKQKEVDFAYYLSQNALGPDATEDEKNAVAEAYAVHQAEVTAMEAERDAIADDLAIYTVAEKHYEAALQDADGGIPVNAEGNTLPFEFNGNYFTINEDGNYELVEDYSPDFVNEAYELPYEDVDQHEPEGAFDLGGVEEFDEVADSGFGEFDFQPDAVPEDGLDLVDGGPDEDWGADGDVDGPADLEVPEVEELPYAVEAAGEEEPTTDEPEEEAVESAEDTLMNWFHDEHVGITFSSSDSPNTISGMESVVSQLLGKVNDFGEFNSKADISKFFDGEEISDFFTNEAHERLYEALMTDYKAQNHGEMSEEMWQVLSPQAADYASTMLEGLESKLWEHLSDELGDVGGAEEAAGETQEALGEPEEPAVEILDEVEAEVEAEEAVGEELLDDQIGEDLAEGSGEVGGAWEEPSESEVAEESTEEPSAESEGDEEDWEDSQGGSEFLTSLQGAFGNYPTYVADSLRDFIEAHRESLEALEFDDWGEKEETTLNTLRLALNLHMSMDLGEGHAPDFALSDMREILQETLGLMGKEYPEVTVDSGAAEQVGAEAEEQPEGELAVEAQDHETGPSGESIADTYAAWVDEFTEKHGWDDFGEVGVDLEHFMEEFFNEAMAFGGVVGAGQAAEFLDSVDALVSDTQAELVEQYAQEMAEDEGLDWNYDDIDHIQEEAEEFISNLMNTFLEEAMAYLKGPEVEEAQAQQEAELDNESFDLDDLDEGITDFDLDEAAEEEEAFEELQPEVGAEDELSFVDDLVDEVDEESDLDESAEEVLTAEEEPEDTLAEGGDEDAAEGVEEIMSAPEPSEDESDADVAEEGLTDEPVDESEVDGGVVSETEVEAEAEAEAEVEVAEEPELETEDEVAPEVAVDVEDESEPESESESESESDAAAEEEIESEPQADTESEAVSEEEPEDANEDETEDVADETEDVADVGISEESADGTDEIVDDIEEDDPAEGDPAEDNSIEEDDLSGDAPEEMVEETESETVAEDIEEDTLEEGTTGEVEEESSSEEPSDSLTSWTASLLTGDMSYGEEFIEANEGLFNDLHESVATYGGHTYVDSAKSYYADQIYDSLFNWAVENIWDGDDWSDTQWEKDAQRLAHDIVDAYIGKYLPSKQDDAGTADYDAPDVDDDANAATLDELGATPEELAQAEEAMEYLTQPNTEAAGADAESGDGAAPTPQQEYNWAAGSSLAGFPAAQQEMYDVMADWLDTHPDQLKWPVDMDVFSPFYDEMVSIINSWQGKEGYPTNMMDFETVGLLRDFLVEKGAVVDFGQAAEGEATTAEPEVDDLDDGAGITDLTAGDLADIEEDDLSEDAAGGALGGLLSDAFDPTPSEGTDSAEGAGEVAVEAEATAEEPAASTDLTGTQNFDKNDADALEGVDLNGVAIKSVKDKIGEIPGQHSPDNPDIHDYFSQKEDNKDLAEPETTPDASGVVVVEPDGRIWIRKVTGSFSGYNYSYARGQLEGGLTAQQNALKEAYEELGLEVEIDGYLTDIKTPSGSTARYYIAKRVGGNPADAGWETEHATLVSPEDAEALLNVTSDKGVLAELVQKLGAQTQEAEPKTPSTVDALAAELEADFGLGDLAADGKADEAAALVTDTEVATTIMDTKTGGATGSNKGGFYTGADGVERYVKFYSEAEQSYGEHAANSLYNAANLLAPNSILFRTENGSAAYASDIIKDTQSFAALTNQGSNIPEDLARQVLDGFALDVLTANWDAVGLVFDNLLVDADGNIIRVDNGGSFTKRAQGLDKPKHLLNEISEFDSFMNPSVNGSYAKVVKAANLAEGEINDLVRQQISEFQDGLAQAGYNLSDDFDSNLSALTDFFKDTMENNGGMGLKDDTSSAEKEKAASTYASMVAHRLAKLKERVGYKAGDAAVGAEPKAEQNDKTTSLKPLAGQLSELDGKDVTFDIGYDGSDFKHVPNYTMSQNKKNMLKEFLAGAEAGGLTNVDVQDLLSTGSTDSPSVMGLVYQLSKPESLKIKDGSSLQGYLSDTISALNEAYSDAVKKTHGPAWQMTQEESQHLYNYVLDKTAAAMGNFGGSHALSAAWHGKTLPELKKDYDTLGHMLSATPHATTDPSYNANVVNAQEQLNNIAKKLHGFNLATNAPHTSTLLSVYNGTKKASQEAQDYVKNSNSSVDNGIRYHLGNFASKDAFYNQEMEEKLGWTDVSMPYDAAVMMREQALAHHGGQASTTSAAPLDDTGISQAEYTAALSDYQGSGSKSINSFFYSAEMAGFDMNRIYDLLPVAFDLSPDSPEIHDFVKDYKAATKGYMDVSTALRNLRRGASIITVAEKFRTPTTMILHRGTSSTPAVVLLASALKTAGVSATNNDSLDSLVAKVRDILDDPASAEHLTAAINSPFGATLDGSVDSKAPGFSPHGGVMFTVKTAEGTPVAYTQAWSSNSSAYTSEQEVLIAPHVEMKIRAITKMPNGKYHIFMESLPSNYEPKTPEGGKKDAMTSADLANAPGVVHTDPDTGAKFTYVPADKAKQKAHHQKHIKKLSPHGPPVPTHPHFPAPTFSYGDYFMSDQGPGNGGQRWAILNKDGQLVGYEGSKFAAAVRIDKINGGKYYTK